MKIINDREFSLKVKRLFLKEALKTYKRMNDFLKITKHELDGDLAQIENILWLSREMLFENLIRNFYLKGLFKFFKETLRTKKLLRKIKRAAT